MYKNLFDSFGTCPLLSIAAYLRAATSRSLGTFDPKARHILRGPSEAHQERPGRGPGALGALGASFSSPGGAFCRLRGDLSDIRAKVAENGGDPSILLRGLDWEEDLSAEERESISQEFGSPAP